MQITLDQVIQNDVRLTSTSHNDTIELDNEHDENCVPNPPFGSLFIGLQVHAAEYRSLPPAISSFDGAADTPVQSMNSSKDLNYQNRQAAQAKVESLRAKLLAQKRAGSIGARDKSAVLTDSNTPSAKDLDKLLEDSKIAALATNSTAKTNSSSGPFQPVTTLEALKHNSNQVLAYGQSKPLVNGPQILPRASTTTQVSSSTRSQTQTPAQVPAQAQIQDQNGHLLIHNGLTDTDISTQNGANEEAKIPGSTYPQVSNETPQNPRELDLNSLFNYEDSHREENVEMKENLKMKPEPFQSMHIDEWLEATGYHDESYRNRALRRHRTLKQLKQQQADLEREALFESQVHTYLYRTHPNDPKSTEKSALKTARMAPPPVPPGNSTAGLNKVTSTESVPARPKSSFSTNTVRPSKPEGAIQSIKGHEKDPRMAKNHDPSIVSPRNLQVVSYRHYDRANQHDSRSSPRDNRSYSRAGESNSRDDTVYRRDERFSERNERGNSPRPLKRKSSFSRDRDFREISPRYHSSPNTSRDYHTGGSVYYPTRRSSFEDY